MLKELMATFFDVKLMENELLLSGYRVDLKGRRFRLFAQDLRENKTLFLLTTEHVFGLPASKKFSSHFNKIKELSYVGVRLYCDFHERNVYSIWEGNLVIIKTELDTFNTARFGRKTKNYTFPRVTKQLIKATKERNLKKYYSEKQEMSIVRKILASEKFVGVIYMNYDKELSTWKPMLQLYSHDGDLILEKPLTNASNIHPLMDFYYNKSDNILYVLSQEMKDEVNISYRVNEYIISE